MLFCLTLSSLLYGATDSTTDSRLKLIEQSIQKIDSIQNVNYIKSNIEFDIKDWNSKVKTLKSENKNEWDGFLVQLLTLLIPIFTAGFAGYLAIKQVEKNGKWVLKQTRANTIAAARIEWMQKIRGNLSRFSSEVAVLNYYLKDVIDEADNGNDNIAKEIYNKQIERLAIIRSISTEIKLLLNINEVNHQKLDEAIDKFVSTAVEDYNQLKNNREFTHWSEQIISLSRIVLKDVWEQAKNEGNDIEE